MARANSPYIYGDYWLDKRRDGRSPTIWQIASGTRQVSYRSTRTDDLETAKARIHGHVERERAKGKQAPEDAKVIPLTVLYFDEKGRKADSAGQVASSIRQFIGFLMQDEATTDLRVSGINLGLWDRFIEWRMGPHEYDVPWRGKDYRHSSPGVSGEAVNRNLDDIRASLIHHVGRNRLIYVPKIPAVPKNLRSPARDLVFTTKQMGAIIGYAAYDIRALRWVLAMIATAARPEALLAMKPGEQGIDDFRLLDIHPQAWPLTDKINPVIPVIPEFAPWLRAWEANPHKPVTSRKTWWRHMRTELGLPVKGVPKTIRHTVATALRYRLKVPHEEVETLLGHLVGKKTTRIYTKYDPSYLADAAKALSSLWAEYCAEAIRWLAVHSLSTPKRGQKLTVVKNRSNLLEMVVGADGLEPPTLSV